MHAPNPPSVSKNARLSAAKNEARLRRGIAEIKQFKVAHQRWPRHRNHESQPGEGELYDRFMSWLNSNFKDPNGTFAAFAKEEKIEYERVDECIRVSKSWIQAAFAPQPNPQESTASLSRAPATSAPVPARPGDQAASLVIDATVRTKPKPTPDQIRLRYAASQAMHNTMTSPGSMPMSQANDQRDFRSIASLPSSATSPLASDSGSRDKPKSLNPLAPPFNPYRGLATRVSSVGPSTPPSPTSRSSSPDFGPDFVRVGWPFNEINSGQNRKS